jgi:iron complex outermembrane receptor protein
MRTNRVSGLLMTSAMTLSLGGIAPVAMAQTAARPAAAKGQGLEEIVVTAQKRRENVQKVSTAVSVLTGRELARQAVHRIADLEYATPSLSITGNGMIQSINIRGVGLASTAPGLVNGVATYHDGLFQTEIATLAPFYDINSVEVLRGPQGTFVGTNSTGGAIEVNSNDPSLAGYSGSSEITVGNYRRIGTTDVVNIPVNDVLAIRGALYFMNHDSYYHDNGPYDNHPGGLNEFSQRVSALYHPTEEFTAVIKLEDDRRDTGGYAWNPEPGSAFTDVETYTLGAGAPTPTALYIPHIYSNPYELYYLWPTKDTERYELGSAKLEYKFPLGITLRSITGVQDQRNWILYDNVATDDPYVSSAQNRFVGARAWSQEFNLVSAPDQPITWVLGTFYLHQRTDADFVNFNAIDPTGRTPFDLSREPYRLTHTANPTTTTGYFGQATYKILPRLSIDVGLRWSDYHDTQTGGLYYLQGAAGHVPGTEQVNLTGDEQESRPTGKIALNYQYDPKNLFYVFVAKGYKPGGVNGGTVPNFGPETVIDYEGGWKSTLLNNHLRTQLGAFYYDYKNFQFGEVSPVTGATQVENVSKSSIGGAEASAQGRFGNLSVTGNVSYIRTHLNPFPFFDNIGYEVAHPGCISPFNPSTTCPGGVVKNVSGPMLYAPEWTAGFTAEYTIYLSNFTLTPHLNYAYVASQWDYPGYSAPSINQIGGHSLLSGLITADFGRYQVEFYGNNLTNARYVSGTNNTNEIFGPPLEFGIRARTTF